MEGTTVYKQIMNFKEYEQRQKTSLAAIQKAYATAGRAAEEAKLAGHPQYLVSCTSPPELVREQRYQVKTLPCGYKSHVASEQVISCCVITRFEAFCQVVQKSAGCISGRVSLLQSAFCTRLRYVSEHVLHFLYFQ